MTGTVTLSPVVAADHVTSRQVVVTLNGTALAPLEAVGGPVSFPCNDGDSYSIVDTDINAAGSTSSDPATGTCHLPLQAPTKPSIVSVVFS